MVKRTIIFLWVIVLIIIGGLFIYFIRSTAVSDPTNPYKNREVYDFSNINFSENRLIKLKGEAEFYEDTFLFKNNITSTPDDLKPAIVKIPSKWNNHKKSNISPSGFGYGTYRFTIIIPEKDVYGIKAKNIKSAYRITVNGNTLGGVGEVGKSKASTKPSRYLKEFYFNADTTFLEVIMHVSNFHHRNGGITGNIFFGRASEVSFWKATQVGIDAFLVGLLFILFIYHLGLYAYRRKDKSILYFSLLCLIMFFRTGYIGEKLFLEVFRFLSWGISTKIEYISFILIPIFTTMFLKEMFPNEFHKWLIGFINSSCLKLN